jgi:hypothetical protein
VAEYAPALPPPDGRLPAPARWYASGWVMLASGYVFPPAGLYLMWRYKPWPRWLKAGITVSGSCLAVVSSYISGRYIWPHVF